MELVDQRKIASLESKGDSSDYIRSFILRELSRLSLSPKKIIDIGCGKGDLLEEILHLFPTAELFASDITNFGLNPKFQFIELDLNLKFSNKLGGFDLITSIEVIEHLENPRHFIRELSTLLNPHGVIVLSTPNIESITSLLSLIFKGYHSAFGGKAYPAHITSISTYEMRNIVNENNLLKLEKIFYIPNGRVPGTSVHYKDFLPFLRGKRFSDNYYVIIRRI